MLQQADTAFRALIVDDQAAYASSIAKELSGDGLAVDSLSANEPAELASLTTQDAAYQHVRDYHAVILDLNLKGISGLDVATAIQERVPDMWIIVLTAHDDLLDLLKQSDDVSIVDAVAKGELDAEHLRTSLRRLDEIRMRRENVCRTVTHHLEELTMNLSRAFAAVASLAEVKRFTRSVLLDLFPSSHPKHAVPRREIALAIFGATEALSMVTGRGLHVPTVDQLSALGLAVATLSQPTVDVFDRRRVDVALQQAGFGLRMDDDHPEYLDLTLEPSEDADS